MCMCACVYVFIISLSTKQSKHNSGIMTNNISRAADTKTNPQTILPTIELRVLFSSTLFFIKNPLLIIDAFKKSIHSNQMLIFLGDGHLQEKCIGYAMDKNILILGKVDNVNEYLSSR